MIFASVEPRCYRVNLEPFPLLLTIGAFSCKCCVLQFKAVGAQRFPWDDTFSACVARHLNSGTRGDNDLKTISSLMARSAQPSASELKKLSRLHTSGNLFKECCLRAVTSAVNPFIPGITLSIRLTEAAKQANEGERRVLSDIQSSVDEVLLEIFERLPQTVDGFEGGMDSCTSVFEPFASKNFDSAHLGGPLDMILSDQKQLETFCEVPLVMDFLSSKFTLGLPDLNDTSGVLRNNGQQKNVMRGDLVLGGCICGFLQTGELKFLPEGATFFSEPLTFFPGLRFVLVGVVAAPNSYYEVPAMRMVLDFVVYIATIAALSYFVFFQSSARSMTGDDLIVDHRFSVSEGACAAIFIAVSARPYCALAKLCKKATRWAFTTYVFVRGRCVSLFIQSVTLAEDSIELAYVGEQTK